MEKKALLKIRNSSLEPAVLVVERRELFGRREALVEPVTGRGRQWVNVKNLIERKKNDN